MWKEQIIEIQLFSEDCFKLCSCENMKTGVTFVLNHNKRPAFAKLNISNHPLQKKRMLNTEISGKSVSFKKNIKNHGLISTLI